MTMPETTNHPADSFAELLHPDQYLGIADCLPGQVYWQGGHNLGAVAICQGETVGGLAFTGLRNKTEGYYVTTDYHCDSTEVGSVRPYYRIGEAPDIAATDELLGWLKAKEIELRRVRLEQLQGIDPSTWPPDLHQTALENEAQTLAQLENPTKPVSMKEIIARKHNQHLI